MNIQRKIAALAMAAITLASVAKTQVPLGQQTLLTIDGQPVTVSEFQYLYNKNNTQQATPQSVDEYLKLFTDYKLKVAEALSQGLDTTASFAAEFKGYARELAEPYLIDKSIFHNLEQEAYSHMAREVEVQHLMVGHENRALIDSLHSAIAAGGDFAEAARRYSIDRSSAQSGGMMGYVAAGRYPWAFEQAVYNTPKGEISPVTTTMYGLHVIKVLGDRPAKGSVLVQHILKLTQNKTADEKAAIRASMDSIHTLLAGGADFDAIAAAESQDPGSARQGGRLPWFTTGQMVKPFEETSFTLGNGELSDVFETAYGFHIVKKLDSKGTPTFEEAKEDIDRAIGTDERANLPRRHMLDSLAVCYNLTDNRPAQAMVHSVIRSHNGLDSMAYAQLSTTPAPLMKYNGGEVLLTDVMARLAPTEDLDQQQVIDIINNHMHALADEALIARAATDLPSHNDDYRNLLNEYRDGILLFEISDTNVWTRAKEDTEGLVKWFEDHRDQYAWPAPKFKSYIIFALNDSILGEAHKIVTENPVEGQQLSTLLRSRLGNSVRVEKVLGAQGENAIVDYLGFGGEKPTAPGKWVSYEAYQPVVIDAPQEMNDVRSQVITDYQSYLEQQWLAQLRKNHKVKVNNKVLKQLR